MMDVSVVKNNKRIVFWNSLSCYIGLLSFWYFHMGAIGVKIDHITEETLRIYAGLKTINERKKYLCKCLNLNVATNFDEHPKEDVIIDLLIDNISFAINFGLNWSHVLLYITFIDKLLISTVIEGVPIRKAVRILKDLVKVHLEKFIPFAFLKASVTHLNGSFFQHYSLYLYLFTSKRDELTGNDTLVIEVPEHSGNEDVQEKLIPNLRNGIPVDKWNHEQQLKDLNARWSATSTERQHKFEEEVSNLEQRKTEIEGKLDASIVSGNKDHFVMHLTEIIKTTVEEAGLDLKNQFETFRDDLSFRIEKGVLENKGKEGHLLQGKSRVKSRLKSLAP